MNDVENSNETIRYAVFNVPGVEFHVDWECLEGRRGVEGDIEAIQLRILGEAVPDIEQPGTS